MEPAREERDDFRDFAEQLDRTSPQWSPLVKSGMTPPANT